MKYQFLFLVILLLGGIPFAASASSKPARPATSLEGITLKAAPDFSIHPDTPNADARYKADFSSLDNGITIAGKEIETATWNLHNNDDNGGGGGGECGTCQGDLKTLTLKYTGSSDAKIKVYQDNEGWVFSEWVKSGKTFTVTLKQGWYGPKGDYIKIYKNDSYKAKFYLRCDKVAPGTSESSFQIVEGTTDKGSFGDDCDDDDDGDDECGTCQGTVKSLTLRYNYHQSTYIEVWQEKGYNNYVKLFAQTVAGNSTFSFNLDANGGDKIYIKKYGNWYELKVSCGKLVPGETTTAYGYITVVGGTSEGGKFGGDCGGGGEEPCATVTKGCITIDILEVVTGTDGKTTYRYRVTSTCNHGLSYIEFGLPAWKKATSYTTGYPVQKVENEKGSIKFELGGDIKNGESVELEYTLPADASYAGTFQVKVKYAWYKEYLTLDPSECTECLDNTPPAIEFNVVNVGGKYYVEVLIKDDAGIESVEFEEMGNNLQEDLASRDFTPGAKQAFFRFHIVDTSLNASLKVKAKDNCGEKACLDDTPPFIVSIVQVAADDQTGTYAPYNPPASLPYPDPSDPSNWWDRFGQEVNMSDIGGGIRYYELFNVSNAFVFQQPVAGCIATDGCELPAPLPNLTFVVATQDVLDPEGGSFGFIVADACNVYIHDPLIETGTAGKGGTAPGILRAGQIEGQAELPIEFALEQNYPNPFNPTTDIHFSLPEASDVRLVVYDLLGQEVEVLVDGDMARGHHAVRFDASRLPSGTYFYRLTSRVGTALHKMVLVK